MRLEWKIYALLLKQLKPVIQLVRVVIGVAEYILSSVYEGRVLEVRIVEVHLERKFAKKLTSSPAA